MIPIDTQKYSLTAGDNAGDSITVNENTIKDIALLVDILDRAGFHYFSIVPEIETPIPDALLTPNAQPGRNPCCQSDHPGPCYGDPWTCERCGKTVCCAEGTDDHPELCDDCWTAEFSSFAQQRMQPEMAEGRA
jgi:hypothetical protein